jgi:hypothetical protein
MALPDHRKTCLNSLEGSLKELVAELVKTVVRRWQGMCCRRVWSSLARLWHAGCVRILGLQGAGLPQTSLLGSLVGSLPLTPPLLGHKFAST